MFKKKFLKKNKALQKQKGMIILITIVISSLMLALGTFIADIAVKEIRLSSSSRDSQKAFFAADAAAECAIFQDIRVKSFKTDMNDTDAPTEISCHGKQNTISVTLENANSAVSYFFVSFADDPADEDSSPYAKVEVTKYDIGGESDKTTIRSYGHSRKRGDNIVERAIEITY